MLVVFVVMHILRRRKDVYTSFLLLLLLLLLLLFQHVCGYEYTARLQRMLVDVTLSSSLITDFMEQLKQQSGSLPITFSTLVLQVYSYMCTE